jgi:integrase
MKSLTRPQLDRLLTVARKHSEQDYLMFAVIFNHGLRITEVTGGWNTVKGVRVYREGLTKANIISGHLVMAREKGSKTTVQPLLLDERAALEHLAATVTGRFFPMSRMTAWRKLQKYGAEAGIPVHFAHPHVLRHSAGRLGYLGGMGVPEVATYLGHRNRGNALIYMEPSESEACHAFAAAVGMSAATSRASGTISA